MWVKRIRFVSGKTALGFVFSEKEEFLSAWEIAKRNREFLMPLSASASLVDGREEFVIRIDKERYLIYASEKRHEQVVGYEPVSFRDLKILEAMVEDGGWWFGHTIRYKEDSLVVGKIPLGEMDLIADFEEFLKEMEIFLVGEDLYLFASKGQTASYLRSEFLFAPCYELFKERCREQGKEIKSHEIMKILGKE